MMLLPLAGGLAAGGGAALGGINAGLSSAIGLMTAGTLFSGVSAYQQGEYNKKVAEQQAEATIRAAEINERKYQREYEQVAAYQRAATGAMGLGLSGSPLQVMIDSAYQYELDRGIRRYNAQIGAQQYEAEGKLAAMRGRSGLLGSLLEAGGRAAYIGTTN
jgi:hypothetical protein